MGLAEDYMRNTGRIALAKRATVVAITLGLMLVSSHATVNANPTKAQPSKTSAAATADGPSALQGKGAPSKASSKVVAVKKQAKTEGAATKPLPAESAPVDVKAANGKPSVLEFGAPWCVPCKVFAPVFKKVKDNFGGQADFLTYDTENPEGEKIANKFNISGVPAIIIVDSSGKVVFRKSGIMDEKTLTAEVTKALGK
jgi:thioredoxin 1